MSNITVVAVDMDGTFLHSDDTYDRERFARMQRLLDDRGIRFVVASGNQYEQLASFFPEPDRFAFVSDNGALVVDAGEPLYSARIDPDVVVRVGDLLDDAGIAYLACGPVAAFAPAWVSDDFCALMGRYYHRMERVGSVSEVRDEVFKFGLVDERGLPEDLAQTVVAGVGDGIVPVVSGHGSMDLGAPGVNKASGLRILLKRWGLTGEGVAAFGDSANDLEMLTMAGRSVAMANAAPAVKEAAGIVTESNDADGVLNQLERWLTQS